MHTDKAFFFLFPHMVVPEWMGRRFDLLLPEIHVLNVLGEDWATNRCWSGTTDWAALTADEERREVRFLLHEYRRLVDVHGSDDLLGVWIRDSERPDLSESRFAIQAHTRGRQQPVFSKEARLRIEAALFLELARDLDEKELELNDSLTHAQQLEDRFRRILGLGEDEEADEVLEAAEVPLAPDWGHFSYQLGVRMGYWWRLFSTTAPSAPVCYVALFEDVIEELIDPIKTMRERDGSAWQPEQVVLAEMGDPADLSKDQFERLKRDVDEQGQLAGYLELVSALVKDPVAGSLLSRFQEARQGLEEFVSGCFERHGWAVSNRIQWVLSDFGEVGVSQWWRRFDRKGWEVLGDSPLGRQRVVTVHCRRI